LKINELFSCANQKTLNGFYEVVKPPMKIVETFSCATLTIHDKIRSNNMRKEQRTTNNEQGGNMRSHRKPRSDRNHIIYQITCKPTGQTYIGVCIVKKQAKVKSLKYRWNGHLRAAFIENRDWNMSRALRQYGEHNFTKTIVEVVRGKAQAYAREAELINILRPALNTKMKKVA